MFRLPTPGLVCSKLNPLLLLLLLLQLMSAILNSHDHGLAELTRKAAEARQVGRSRGFTARLGHGR
jgi:hypothetical protein